MRRRLPFPYDSSKISIEVEREKEGKEEEEEEEVEDRKSIRMGVRSVVVAVHDARVVRQVGALTD